MELSFLCCMAFGVLMAAVFTVGIAVSLFRRLGRQREDVGELHALLESLGLEEIPGSSWRRGSFGGSELLVRAAPRISLGMHGIQGDERYSVGLDLMAPVELPPTGGMIARERKPKPGAETFEEVFYAGLGAQLDAVSPRVAEALLARVAETNEYLELVDRNSSGFLAGPVLTDASVVLNLEPRRPAPTEELGTWLEGVAAFARRLGEG